MKYLITADVINSKVENKSLAQILLKNDEIEKLRSENNIEKKNISIVAGDQLRVLCNSLYESIKIGIQIMVVLNKYDMLSRLFISHSEERINPNYSNLSEATGEVFFKNNDLENRVKKDREYYNLNQYTFRSSDVVDDIMLYGMSLICLKRADNIGILYDYHFKKLSQKEIANKYNISQAAVSKKLLSMNYSYFKLVLTSISC